MLNKNKIQKICGFGVHPTKGLLRYYEAQTGIDGLMRLFFKLNVLFIGLALTVKFLSLMISNFFAGLIILPLLPVAFVIITPFYKVLVELIVHTTYITWGFIKPILTMTIERMTR
ncbi:hypothetical protein [uncultured Shewanella sp.]|uniref:hypothetical protein n=1 Tax=uncultured Shewanella sp. TaxID=173975 RepID=UPI00261D73BB|nr:hypothetical protein [uncultured Shewanella sp.]